MDTRRTIVLFSQPRIEPVFVEMKEETPVSTDDLVRLSMAMLDDVVEAALHVDDARVVVYHNGETFSEEYRTTFSLRISSCETGHDGFEMTVLDAMRDAGERTIFLFENQPRLTSAFLERVFDQVSNEETGVVIGPTYEERVWMLGAGSVTQLLGEGKPNAFSLDSHSMMENLCQSDVAVFPTEVRHSLVGRVGLDQIRSEVELESDARPRRTLAALDGIQHKVKSKRRR